MHIRRGAETRRFETAGCLRAFNGDILGVDAFLVVAHFSRGAIRVGVAFCTCARGKSARIAFSSIVGEVQFELERLVRFVLVGAQALTGAGALPCTVGGCGTGAIDRNLVGGGTRSFIAFGTTYALKNVTVRITCIAIGNITGIARLALIGS